MSNPTDALIAQLVALDNGLEAIGAISRLSDSEPLRAALEAQVLQLRAQVTAALALIPGAEEECSHENKIDESTMGRTRWTCRDCGHIYDSDEQQES